MTLRLLPLAALVCLLQVSGQAQTDAPFQIRYFANLDIADSLINLTNNGTVNGSDPAGRVCANIYAFDASGAMVSCCACPLAPNGLNSLSINNDILSNPITPAVTTSLTVRMVATLPNSGACNPNLTAGGTLSSGVSAWGVTVRSTRLSSPPVTLFTSTETEFSKGTLSASELAKLTSTCAFIQMNGSGFGICRSCRLGAK